MTEELWEQQLADPKCDLFSLTARFYDHVEYLYLNRRNYDDLAYHRDIRKFIDAYCANERVFTKGITRMIYGIMDNCFDVSLYRKAFSHGMKIYAFRCDNDYLLALSSSHMIAFVEADVENKFVGQEIGEIPRRLKYPRSDIDETIDLTFLIEA